MLCQLYIWFIVIDQATNKEVEEINLLEYLATCTTHDWIIPMFAIFLFMIDHVKLPKC